MPDKHVLIFLAESDARSAASEISQVDGLKADVQESHDRGDWSVIVTASASAPADVRQRLESEANRFGGTYDGWERQVPRHPGVAGPRPLN